MQNLSCPKSIFFDLDGTLITCRQRQITCLLHLLSRAGLSTRVDLDLIWQFKRSGESTKQALINSGIEESCASNLVADWVRLIETPYWLNYDRSHEFIFDFFDFLSGRDVYLLTARKDFYFLHYELRRLRLNGYFRAVYVVSPENATEEKSQLLCRYKPDLFIGDTVSDLLASKKAECEFIGVTWGLHEEQYLLSGGWGQVVGDPYSLKHILA